jgi:hypothetical protein
MAIDLLNARIETHSGIEDDFEYSDPYILRDWDQERNMTEWDVEEEAERLRGSPDMIIVNRPDPWVNQKYRELPEYSKHPKRQAAKKRLMQYVEEQNRNLESSLDALKQIVSSMTRLRNVSISAWVCLSLGLSRFDQYVYYSSKILQTEKSNA